MSKTNEGLGFLMVAAGMALRQGADITRSTFWATHADSVSFASIEECDNEGCVISSNGAWKLGLVRAGSGIPILAEAESQASKPGRVLVVVDTLEDSQWFSLTPEEIADAFASAELVHGLEANAPGGEA